MIAAATTFVLSTSLSGRSCSYEGTDTPSGGEGGKYPAWGRATDYSRRREPHSMVASATIARPVPAIRRH